MAAGDSAWFEEALNKINKDVDGALGTLSPDDIEVAKTAMLSAMRATIVANPQGFRDLISRLVPHKEQFAKASKKAADNLKF